MKLKTKLVSISAMVAWFAFIGCETNSTGPQNKSPVITSLTTNPDTVVVKGNSTFTCVANDPDVDSVTYIWKATSGSVSGSGSAVIWTAPSSRGSFPITWDSFGFQTKKSHSDFLSYRRAGGTS